MNGRVRISTTLALVLLTAGPSWAHGNAKASLQPVAVVKEQKPWGIAGDDKAVTRTIEVRMTDNMRFTPDRLRIRQGETVRLVVHNAGKQLHEIVIGTRDGLDAHAAMMLKHPGMEHDEPYMTHVKPGRKGTITWNFNRPGVFQFACLIAGHYQAGMAGTLTVAPAAKQGNKS